MKKEFKVKHHQDGNYTVRINGKLLAKAKTRGEALGEANRKLIEAMEALRLAPVLKLCPDGCLFVGRKMGEKHCQVFRYSSEGVLEDVKEDTEETNLEWYVDIQIHRYLSHKKREEPKWK